MPRSIKMVTNKIIYFDINIIIDLLDDTRINNGNAKRLIRQLTLENFQIVMSEDMLTTIFDIVKDKKSVLEFFNSIQNKWILAPFGKELIQDAIKLSMKMNLDLEDVLQCLCAKKNACEVLITNDKKFHDCGMKIVGYDYFEI